MRERQVDIHDLESRLAEYIRDIEAGATVVITDNGRHVARIVPEGEPLEQLLSVLNSTGALPWSGRRLAATPPDVRLQGTDTVSEIVVENRK